MNKLKNIFAAIGIVALVALVIAASQPLVGNTELMKANNGRGTNVTLSGASDAKLNFADPGDVSALIRLNGGFLFFSVDGTTVMELETSGATFDQGFAAQNGFLLNPPTNATPSIYVTRNPSTGELEDSPGGGGSGSGFPLTANVSGAGFAISGLTNIGVNMISFRPSGAFYMSNELSGRISLWMSNDIAMQWIASGNGGSAATFVNSNHQSSITPWARLNVHGYSFFDQPVGIGIDPAVAPSYTLHVNGSISATNLVPVSTNNDSAPVGFLGEFSSSLVASGSPVSLTTATAANIASLSLTPGDWDVSGNVNLSANTATVTGAAGGITTTSATIPTDGSEVYSGVQVTLLSETDSVTLPRKRISLAVTTTVYLVGRCTFSAGTVGAFGQINARRVR